MKTIKYNADGMNGYSVADGNAEKFVLSFLDGNMDEVTVNTSNVIQAARALSLEQGFPIRFKFNEKIITPNEYGAIRDWPKGFCDLELNWATRVLTFAINKRQSEKK